jgi:hypothetical protein
MTTIEIFFKESEFSKLEICINKNPVEYTVHDNIILIEKNIDFGIHQLSISLVQGARLEITNVKIDGASLRMLIYMSYLEQENNRIQPATTIWDPTQTWYLPFGNPVSFWISLVYKKITNGEFGKNLFDRYYFYYPDSIELDNTFPSIVRSFFKHNFDFVCIDRSTPISQLPYYPINLPINSEKQKLALNEVINAQEWISQHKQDIAQSQYNSEESNTETEWIRQHLIQDSKTIIDSTKFPAVYDFVDSLGISDIKSMFIGILPPGGYIAPHNDRKSNICDNDYLDYNLYIPLSWHEGNYFKFNGAGTIKDGRPILMNNLDYVHCLVNNSNSKQDRIIIRIRISIEKNPNIINYV